MLLTLPLTKSIDIGFDISIFDLFCVGFCCCLLLCGFVSGSVPACFVACDELFVSALSSDSAASCGFSPVGCSLLLSSEVSVSSVASSSDLSSAGCSLLGFSLLSLDLFLASLILLLISSISWTWTPRRLLRLLDKSNTSKASRRLFLSASVNSEVTSLNPSVSSL